MADFNQVGNDFQTMTPGSAVAGQLQNILARKREEAQLALVNRLKEQELNDQRAKMQADVEEGKIRAKAYQAEYEGLGAMNQARAKDIQDKAAQRAKMQETLRGMDISGLPDEVKRLWPMVVNDPEGELSKVLLNRLLTPEKNPELPVFRVDRQGNVIKTDITAPQGAHFATTPAPPSPPAGTQPQLYQTPDPANPGQFLSYWLKPGEQPSEANRVNTTLRKGNVPTPPKEKVVPSTLLNALRTARKLATPTPGKIWGETPPKAGDLAAYRTAQDNVIATYPTTPDVQDTVTDILNTKEWDNVSTDDVVKYYADNKVFEGEELEDFKQLLRHVRER